MSDLETFKELLRGMAEAKSTTELWFKQAAFMLWCGDNPDKLANLIAHPAQPLAQVDAEAAATEIYQEDWGGDTGCTEVTSPVHKIATIIRKHTLAVEPTAQEDEP